MKNLNLKNQSIEGITLISLVITIIILLILAGITIATLTGNNGLLTKASRAKIATEIGEEKEIIGLSVIQASSNSKNGDLYEDKFQEALNENSKLDNNATIIASDIESFTVKFESKRYYEVNKNGNIEYIEDVTGVKKLTVQCVNSQNTPLGKYEYTILTDKYSKIAPEIEGYEASEEKIEGDITEDKTINVLYYLVFNDDKTLVFTGLDASGNITENENSITSYMIGDGSSTKGNGLKEKNVNGILEIPETYNKKKVLKIGKNAFFSCSNILKVDISNNIEKIDNMAFNTMDNLKYLVIGNKVENLGDYVFFNCYNLEKIVLKNSIDKWGVHSLGGLTNWTKIEIDENNTLYKVEDNILYSKEGSILKLCPRGRTGEVLVPESVEVISDNGFAYTHFLSSVIITKNVKEIKNNAFNSSHIEKITIGESVDTIGESAFNNCNKLKTVFLDSSDILKKLNSQTACGRLIFNAENIYIKDGIDELGDYIIDNYKLTDSDEEGYIKYIKNAE